MRRSLPAGDGAAGVKDLAGNVANRLRSDARVKAAPWSRAPDLGFRCAKDP